MKDWERNAWERFAAAAMTMAAESTFRPMYVGRVAPETDPEERARFAEALANLGTDCAIVSPPFDVDVIRPDAKAIAKACADLADAMVAEEKRRLP